MPEEKKHKVKKKTQNTSKKTTESTKDKPVENTSETQDGVTVKVEKSEETVISAAATDQQKAEKLEKTKKAAAADQQKTENPETPEKAGTDEQKNPDAIEKSAAVIAGESADAQEESVQTEKIEEESPSHAKEQQATAATEESPSAAAAGEGTTAAAANEVTSAALTDEATSAITTAEASATRAVDPSQADSSTASGTGNNDSNTNDSSNNNVQPRKSGHGVLIGCMIGIAVLAGAGGWYAYEAQNYRDKFIATTTLNGIDVSGMTAEEAEAAIAEKVEDYDITVTLPDGTTETLNGSDVGMKYASNGEVESRLEHQMIYLWGGKFIGLSYAYDVEENYTIDEETLKTAVEAFPAFDEANYTAPVNAHMELTKDNKIQIVPETEGNQLDESMVENVITEAISNREDAVTIDDSYYLKPTILSDDAQLTADTDTLNTFLSTKITMTLHDSSVYTIDASVLKDCLTLNADTGKYTVDDATLKAKSVEIAADIASKDNATYTSYPFQSTLQGTVNMPCDTYGCTVDEASTADEIYSYLTAGGENSAKPVYSWEICYPVGNTYAEVDIIDQMVYLYVDGTCVVSSSCVSGTDTDPEKRSDRGIFYVTWMATDYTMYGPSDANGNPSYASFVNYAVFYNGGEALHDAPWRSSFGGDTYLYSGSHGCINLPYSAAQTIYSYAYEGMPVIVFG